MDHVADEGGERARKGGFELLRIGGIRIRLDYSWFLIFLLILVTLSVGYFPGKASEAGTVSHWAAGLIAAVLFFAAILAHELAHSWVAVRAGIPVPEITLFLFGGVSSMAQEPRSPQVELRVALAGPLMSFAIALGFWLLGSAWPDAPWILPAIFGYMALINLALGIFNLLPGFPLDGGRVLRAIVWWRTGSLRRATRIASSAGRSFGIALMILGGLQILAGAFIGGLWTILIAMFLHGLAKQGYEELVLRTMLSGVEVERIMIPDGQLVSVPADLPLRELVDDYFLALGHRGFPVVEDGHPIGVVSTQDLRRTPRETWPGKTVRDVMTPLDERSRIAPDDSVLEALKRLRPGGPSRLIVTSNGRMLGLVSAGNVSRYVEVRSLVQEG